MIKNPALMFLLAPLACLGQTGLTAAYNVFGDSITNPGFSASDPPHAYANLIRAAQGTPSNNNQGISGSQITTQIDPIYATTVAQDSQSFILSGYNDMRNYGSNAAGQLTYSDTLRAGLAWLAIPETAKIRGTAETCTFRGRWDQPSFYGLGKYSSTAGATVQCPLTGTVAYVGYIKFPGTAGSFKVAIDGASYGAVNANGGTTDGNGRPYSAGLFRAAGLPPGAHTITLTQTGGTVYFDWVAGLNPAAQASRTPAGYVGNTLRMNPAGYALGGAAYANGSDAAVTQFNAIIASVVHQLAGDGLNVKLVDASSSYNPVADVSGDNIHPNDQGHAKLSLAFLTVMNATTLGISIAVQTAGAFGASSSIAPGSWIEIYGSNLSSTSRSWTGADFNGVNAPTSLDGIKVTIGNQAAFIDYISAGQVNAQVPSGVGTGPQTMTVSTVNGISAPYTVTMNATQPGLYAPPNLNIGGKQYVGALFPDGITYVLPPGAVAGAPSRQAKPGDTIVVSGIGFGLVNPNIPAGQTVQQNNSLASPLHVFFGATPATLSYSGLAPGAVGLYQFNVVVPDVANSDAVPLTFSLNGVPGAQTLFTAVHN